MALLEVPISRWEKHLTNNWEYVGRAWIEENECFGEAMIRSPRFKLEMEIVLVERFNLSFDYYI